MYKIASLPPAIQHVVLAKGTEPPFSSSYQHENAMGTYLCRVCGQALFRSTQQFHAACGWPSFDAEINSCVLQLADQDGKRTEILCNKCQAHLGHIFTGEGFTNNNVRYCVNGLSLDYVPSITVLNSEEAIFAGGCFWGVDYFFKKLPGVLKVEVGYCGGHQAEPTYTKVCQGGTGHYEAVRVLYDTACIDYQHIAQYFFEIHDPTQGHGQGNDIGTQYQSAAFYYDAAQKEILLQLSAHLEKKGYQIKTKFLPVSPFWPAEGYHQDYYLKQQKTPYCHQYTARFDPE